MPTQFSKSDSQFRQDILEAALTFAETGIPVFPLHVPINGGCSCQDIECHHIGKHPRTRHGLKDASTDLATIDEWFGGSIQSNLAAITGPESGLLILDVDGPTGEQSLAELEKKYGALPPCSIVKTGNGKHFYFRYPEVGIQNSVSKLGPGLDIRGAAGYVILPPSLHQNGSYYEWC